MPLAQSVIRKTLCAAALTLLSMQAGAFAANMIQPYKLVSMPTAEILPRSYFDVEMNYYASLGGYGSGFLAGVHMGLTNRFMLGVSYGGEGLIGHSDDLRLNTFRGVIYPGVLVKYRIVEEGTVPPAITIGFDNQGYGGLAGEGGYGHDGYVYKAPGLFAAVSKSYMLKESAMFGFHGTLNYAIEGNRDMRWGNYLNLSTGIDIAINEELAFIAEYDMALNDITGPKNRGVRRMDEEPKYFAPLSGFLNLGLRWAFTENFHIQADFRDVLENKLSRTTELRPPLQGAPDERVYVWRRVGWSRELKVIYITKF